MTPVSVGFGAVRAPEGDEEATVSRVRGSPASGTRPPVVTSLGEFAVISAGGASGPSDRGPRGGWFAMSPLSALTLGAPGREEALGGLMRCPDTRRFI